MKEQRKAKGLDVLSCERMCKRRESVGEKEEETLKDGVTDKTRGHLPSASHRLLFP